MGIEVMLAATRHLNSTVEFLEDIDPEPGPSRWSYRRIVYDVPRANELTRATGKFRDDHPRRFPGLGNGPSGSGVYLE